MAMGLRLQWLRVVFAAAFLLTPLAAGAAGWEVGLVISQGDVTARLSFGQQGDASAGRDGRYDVPAMLSGSLQTWFATGADQLWRDIRQTGRLSATWELRIAADHAGVPVRIAWNPKVLPSGMRLTLVDEYRNAVVDMQRTPWYTFSGRGVRTLRVTADHR